MTKEIHLVHLLYFDVVDFQQKQSFVEGSAGSTGLRIRRASTVNCSSRSSMYTELKQFT